VVQVTDVVLGLAAGVGIDLEPGGKTAYYVEWSIGELSKVEIATGAISSVLTGLAFPQDVEVDWDSGQIFVSERTGSISTVFPNEGKKVIATPGGAPHQLDLKKKGSQRFLYTVCFDSGDLVQIDPDASTMATLVSGLGHPVGIVVDDAQQFAYVTEQDSGALTQIELASGAKKQLITGLTAPFFLAWDRDAKGIYCVQRDPANNLLRLDLGSLATSVVANGLAWRPSGVAPNDDDSLIYVCTDRALQVISASGVPPVPPPKLPFEIHSVAFNFDGSPAIRLRDPLAGPPVPTPEYVKGVRNGPASFVAGSLPQVKVVLARLPGFGAGPYAIGATGSLGGIRRKAVTPVFSSSGLSDPIDFEFMWPLARAVAKPDVSLEWYARPATTPGVPGVVGSAVHKLYVPFERPVDPWPGEGWTRAFELACSWAEGATSLDEAAGRVTEGYNGSGMVSYDTVAGATLYGFSTYHLTEMIERLAGGLGLGPKVNCTDSADTVTTLSNLLGCELWESRMGYNFNLNPIIAIGYSNWIVPFAGGFSYHEVAWKGGATEHDNVFDGCLQVDADSDPTAAPHTPLLPTNMLFGDCTTMNYRLRLCPPGPAGCDRCVPQPDSTRKRRPID
jgi:DNA-binding beta-propeller fold protein YncE